MRKYVIMGIQGSGKGTQAKMLAADWPAPGILEALIPGRMQGHGGTAEVSR